MLQKLIFIYDGVMRCINDITPRKSVRNFPFMVETGLVNNGIGKP